MERSVRTLGVLVLLLAGWSGTLAAQRKADPLAGLDQYVEQVRQAWNLPGVAVGIVHRDSLIYAKGFGVKEIGKPDPVRPTTIFAIGSNTKSFVSTAAAMLVDDKVMTWDDRVTRWLPGFQLYDPYVTRELTLRDVLSHRSGLGRRGDPLWYGTSYSRDEILHRIRHLTPNASFRTEMGYQNVMFLAAGEMVGRAAGMSFDDVVRRRIFAPLGMDNSSLSTNGLAQQADVSTPHAIANGSAKPIPWRNLDNAAPAGSINSSIVEMAGYVRLHLANGVYNGKRLVSEANLAVAKTPHINSGGAGDSVSGTSSYGLGWVITTYRGARVAWHNGGIDGMLSEMWTLPDAQVGIVVLTNGSPHSAGPAIVSNIMDRFLLGAPAKDYLAEGLERNRAAAARQAEAAKRMADARVSGTRPSLPLERYAGTYTDPLYGDLSVSVDGNRLRFRWQGIDVPAEHWHFNTFRDGARSFLFQLDADAKVSEVEVSGLATFHAKAGGPGRS
ncbi:MAG: serine hydrolase [Gemmatimonadales bacterium]|nr:serine hydrolase [Gemmatimonadales bacterium]